VEGQIGLEPTPEEHVEKMVEVFREVRRVLRDDGTLWLNYGDCYAASGRKDENGCSNRSEFPEMPGRSPSGPLKPKDLVGMPWRIAFALQADGWYLRSDIIWSKPNPMPESVTDRPTKSHEYVFLLSKRPRYFYDADAIREAHKEPNRGNGERDRVNYNTGGIIGRGRVGEYEEGVRLYNPAGRNRRTVWEIATQPMPDAHFATFPEALVEPCIKAGTSERGCCPECGAPWRRVTERGENTGKNGRYDASETTLRNDAAKHSGRIGETPVHTVGWQPSCTCGREETMPCVVLDPFGGSGTVAKVARDLGRSSISCELNPEYVEIAKKRLRIGEQLDSGVCEYEVRSLLRGE
ncbi:MAG TPA: site-specific DNA-methyltransferase, partial [Methanoculleus sp.]|nr:site-specific DNA-methyltransferase [Methanoculleus sp.]